MSDSFRVTRDPQGAVGVVQISLNRPDSRNAMDGAFWRRFPELLHDLDNDSSVRAVVLSGEGPHFTSGIDLGFLQSIVPVGASDPARRQEKLRRAVKDLQDTVSAAEHCRLPIIAAIHGACIGAGVDLICATDIRYATSDAIFRIEEINIGIVADVGTLQRMPKIIAPGLVRELALTGRNMSADEALRAGFVTAVLPTRDELLSHAIGVAKTIADKSPLAVAGTKHVLNYARDHSVADGLDQVATWNAGHLSMEDVMRGVTAFKTKQKPSFDGLLS